MVQYYQNNNHESFSCRFGIKDSILKTNIKSRYGCYNDRNLRNSIHVKNLIITHYKTVDIASYNLENFVNLEYLGITQNENLDLPLLCTSIKNLTNLKELDLVYNNITDVMPLKMLTNLKELDLRGNNTTYYTPLKILTNLKKLSIDYINKRQLKELQKQMPNCEIYYPLI